MTRTKSNIPWLDHTFEAEDILRGAGRAALRLSSAFAETGNEAVADKIENIASAIDMALGQLRNAHMARNEEICANMGYNIGSTLSSILKMADTTTPSDAAP